MLPGNKNSYIRKSPILCFGYDIFANFASSGKNILTGTYRVSNISKKINSKTSPVRSSENEKEYFFLVEKSRYLSEMLPKIMRLLLV